MPRLIDADKLLEYKFVHDIEYSPSTDIAYELWRQGWNDALDAVINEAPIADAEYVRHGHWIGKEDQKWHCSECDGIAPKGYRYNYCPFCGAKMDEVEEDAEIN